MKITLELDNRLANEIYDHICNRLDELDRARSGKSVSLPGEYRALEELVKALDEAWNKALGHKE